MAKNSLLDYSTTPSNNTDIAGISIVGTAPVNNFDDAFRTIMAQMKSDLDYKRVFSTKSANYTAVANDNNGVIRFTSSATLSLTSAVTLGNNWHLLVASSAGATVTIDPAGSETINATSTLVIQPGFVADISCNGTAFIASVAPDATIVDYLLKSGGTLTGDVLFGPGTSGRYSKLQANGDVQLNRGDNTGYNTWNVANAYHGWDGTRYVYGPAGGVAITGGNLTLDTNVAITFAGTGASQTKTNLGITKYKSGNITATLGGLITQPHGLGFQPSADRLFATLINTSGGTDNGYAAGIELACMQRSDSTGSAAGYGLMLWADTTNIYARVGNTGLAVVLNGSTGVMGAVLGVAQWAVRLGVSAE